MESEFRHQSEIIRREIEETLLRSGILFRAFGRGKTIESIKKKIDGNPGKYSLQGRLIQDAIGIRVALYFFEDTAIVHQLLAQKYKIVKDATTVDQLNNDQFTVNRHNLVFKVSPEMEGDMSRLCAGKPIDFTFEVQLRSILSEGWHEVDHDLRYKCKAHWQSQTDLERALNGILATLETSEWSMKKIFDDLAYRNYKSQNWPAMLHNKFRMRTAPELSPSVIALLDAENNLAKSILRVDRAKVIMEISRATPRIPVSLDNILYVANLVGPKHSNLIAATPSLLIEALNH